MTPFLVPGGMSRFIGVNGAIVPLGKLYFYESGTLIESPVYDEDGDQLAQPIQGDITGAYQQVYLNPILTYRVRLETADGVEIFDVDPYTVGGLPGFNVLTDFDSFQDALDYIGDNGGTLAIPAGGYPTSVQLTLTQSTFNTIHIMAHGAKITTTGAIAGFKITDSNFIPSQIVIEGLTISHLNNATATAGFDLSKSSLVTLRNCIVEAYGNQASYAGFWLHNKTANDDNTGCFWCTLDHCSVRSQSGGTIPCGVRLQGAANATRIIGGSYGGVTTTCIQLTYEVGQSTIPNGVVIDGASFETFTTAVHVLGETTHPVGGLRVVNCRAEDGTTFVSLTGTTTTTAFGSSPTVIENNYIIPSMTRLNNPNGLPIKPVLIASGVATFAAATTVSVTLPYAEPDGNYTVTVTPLADPVGRLSTPSGSKIGASFVIANSSSTSISVQWQAYR